MRCRECGLELDERDQLRNGAYQCPECGTIHHTAASSRVSPSPWRRKRRSALPSDEGVLTRRVWALPMWSWIVIAAAVIAALVLLLVFGGRFSAPSNPEMPTTQDIPLTDGDTSPEGSPEEGAPLDGAEDALLSELDGQTQAQATGSTNVAANDFLVGFEWAMSYLNYTSTTNLASEETLPSGETVQNYSYEDWLHFVITLEPGSSIIRSCVASADSGASADMTRITAAFVCALYGIDNTMTAGSASAEINTMLNDETYSLTRNGFNASISHSESSGYTLQILGKL